MGGVRGVGFRRVIVEWGEGLKTVGLLAGWIVGWVLSDATLEAKGCAKDSHFPGFTNEVYCYSLAPALPGEIRLRKM